VAFGGRVCVGNFNANGLKVNDDNDDNDNDNIGRALARNFCLPFGLRARNKMSLVARLSESAAD